jgi:hypothetical protein
MLIWSAIAEMSRNENSSRNQFYAEKRSQERNKLSLNAVSKTTESFIEIDPREFGIFTAIMAQIHFSFQCRFRNE